MAARAKTAREVRLALRETRRLCEVDRSDVRICWDLDNTLVDSGSLLRAGLQLDQAIVDASPMSNMLGFVETLRHELPEASHFILSARARTMHEDTVAWCSRHGLSTTCLCLVPNAQVKPRIWDILGRGAKLVIVDDLSHGHEGEETTPYDELVEAARRIAHAYVGVEDIARITADSDVGRALAVRTVSQLNRQ